jgi:hypothetical protein
MYCTGDAVITGINCTAELHLGDTGEASIVLNILVDFGKRF